MAYRLMIIPGDSPNLRSIPEYMGDTVEVQVVDDANSALWEIRSSAPEVVLANLELQDMTGLDLAEIIPNFGLATRVILWSQHPNPQAEQQASELGVSHVLNEQHNAGELRSIILQELQEAQAAAVAKEQAPQEEAQQEAEFEQQHEQESSAETTEEGRERRRRLHDVAPAPPPVERSRRMHDVAPAPTGNEPRRRLHDVAPAPPPIERRPRKPQVESLAERARRAAQENPEPASIPSHHETAPARPSQTRQGAIVVTAESSKPIRNRMAELEREVGSMCIMLADKAGMVLAEVGATGGIPTMILLPMLSTSFSTAGQIAQMLGEKGETSALYMHEGDRYDVYCFKLTQGYMLVIVFQKGSSAVKIGTVWVYAKRAIRDIEDLLG